MTIGFTSLLKIKLFFLVFLFFVSSFKISAVTRYWIGGSSSAWNNNANWGTSSGAGAPASVPTTTDIAIFDNGSLANCALSSNVVIGSLSLTPGFTQTLSQGAFTFSVTGNSLWSGGTFLGGSANIFQGGTFNLSGTNFTSSSGTLTISGTFSFSSGLFNHNNGTVKFANNSFSVSGSPVFNHLGFISNYNTLTFSSSFTVAGNLTIGSNNGAWTIYNIAASQSITVNGTLYLIGNMQATINTGIITAKGDVIITSTSTYAGGTGTINIAGGSNQTLTGSGVFNQGNLPSVMINKPSGTLNLSGYITVTGPSWNYVAGTLAAGTSTVCFFNISTPYTISGTHTLNKVILYGNYAPYTINNDLTVSDFTMDASLHCDMKLNSSLTVNGNLLINGSGFYKINTGILNAKGNIINNNTNVTTGGGTGSVIVNGTGNQILIGSASINQGALPPFIIDKPSGTLYLTGIVNLYYGFTWLAGVVDPGTSTCVFSNMAALGSQLITVAAANMSFYNVIFDQPDYVWTQLQTDISIIGSLTITAGSGIQTNNHTILLAGNFTSLNTTASGSSYVFNGSTYCSVILNGSGPGPQIITSNNSSGSANKAVFYNLTLNNSASRNTNDDVVLNGILYVGNSITFTNGKLYSALTNFIQLKDGATANIGNDMSYVNGSMRYEMAFNGNRTLNFPIGEANNWRYLKLNLTHNSGVSYTYIGEVIKNSAANFSYTLPTSINKVSDIRYAEIGRILTSTGSDSNAGLSGNQSIVMHFDTSDMVSDYTNLTIAETATSGVSWIDIGGIASSNVSGTIISTSTPSAFVSFSSKFTLANRPGGSNPLPIELTDFSVELCSKYACLKWETATEKGNAFFTLEKSSDGSTFETMGTVKGAINSSKPLFYNFEDLHPYDGISYYRLKQTDVDGKYMYHKMISLLLNDVDNGLTISPNPNYGEQVLFTTNKPEVQLSLRNTFGEVLTSFKIYSGTTKMDFSYLSSGIYFVVAEKTGVVTKLIIKN